MMRIAAMLAGSLCLAGWLSIVPLAGQAGTEEGGYQVIANAFGFGCQIDDAPDASKNIREIAIDELNIDARETTTGLDVEYRTYSPGAAHWGQAKFTSACTLGGSKELQQLFQSAAKGKNIRKNITVTLFKSDKSPGRSYSLIDAIPVGYIGCDKRDPNGTETIIVEPQYILFGAPGDAPIPNKPPAAATFRLDLAGADGTGSGDYSWELANGGAASHEDPPLVIGKFDPASPAIDLKPRRTVSALTLRGAMTAERKQLMTWLNDVVQGRDWRRQVAVSPLGQDGNPSRHYIYADVFPVRYVFPRMSVTNTTGNVMEEVALKPIRVELK